MGRMRYGRRGPLSDECLWVKPADATVQYRSSLERGALNFRRASSGKILGGDWDLNTAPIGSSVKFKACMAHFRDGVPWEETGLFEEMKARIARDGVADGCRTYDDILARYAALDAVAEDARRLGRLKARSELPGHAFRREHGGIFGHINRAGQFLRAGGGQHRFAMAKALNLSLMPVQVGVIHAQAFEDGALERLRAVQP